MPINETHDPKLKSWVESANDPETEFPIQNLPYCLFWAPQENTGHPELHFGVVIGDQILDVSLLASRRLHSGYLGGTAGDNINLPASDDPNGAWSRAMMARVMADSIKRRSSMRADLVRLLRTETSTLRDDAQLREKVLKPLAELSFPAGMPDVPCTIGNYTDFYASVHHATTVGSMFRPDNPLLPNYKHIPIGYHGRASSVVASGTEIARPRGQMGPPEDKPGEGPAFGPCRMLDYELEVGWFVGPGNELGKPIDIRDAERHIFGLCLVNDWSARDIQKWEYQPLGPFLAKNFATTISPYIVTLEALEPFRCPAYRRPEGDPRPLPYLFGEENESRGGIDITLEVWLQSEEMRKRGLSPARISRSNAFKEMYWTIAQMLTHHASNGCNLQPGDLMASGTVSGLGPTERGCLLEATWAGRGADGKPLPRKAIELPSGEKRLFLEDGDEVIFKGYCEREGFRKIGFGECRGRVRREG